MIQQYWNDDIELIFILKILLHRSTVQSIIQKYKKTNCMANFSMSGSQRRTTTLSENGDENAICLLEIRSLWCGEQRPKSSIRNESWWWECDDLGLFRSQSSETFLLHWWCNGSILLSRDFQQKLGFKKATNVSVSQWSKTYCPGSEGFLEERWRMDNYCTWITVCIWLFFLAIHVREISSWNFGKINYVLWWTDWWQARISIFFLSQMPVHAC